MLDIKFIRDNKDVVAAGAKKKRINFNVDELIAVDDERRAIISKVEEKRARQNEVSTKIVSATPEQKVKTICIKLKTVIIWRELLRWLQWLTLLIQYYQKILYQKKSSLFLLHLEERPEATVRM